MSAYRAFFSLLTLGLLMALGGCFEERQRSSSPAAQEAPEQSGFVGSEVCQACHVDLFDKFATTRHAALLRDEKAAPPSQGCEACHGPGAAHVAAGGGKGVGGLLTFRAEAATTRAEVCLTCHQRQTRQFRFRRSEHKLTGVACNDCHTLHFPAVEEGLLRQKTPELCFACHQEVRSDFALPVRHNVLEGALSCTDCHAPHGEASRFTLRGGHNETCARCHREKDGPFAFEHLASRIDGCTACHLPHGSPNPFLLKRRQERVLCLECHSNAPLFHNQTSGALFRGACTRCHTAIHGSNFDRLFFR
jgi:DmsE family decaheme c-type cytochrome